MFPGISHRKKRTSQLVTLAIAALVLPFQAAHAQAAKAQAAFELRLEKMPAAEALVRIAKTTGASISFDPVELRGFTANEVQGSLTASQALRTALASTGLGFVESEKNAFIVTKASNSARAAQSDRGPVWELPEVFVQAKRQSLGYAADSTRTASRSETDLLDVAKSVSTVSRELMNDQQSTTALDALRNAAGLRVDALASDASPRFSLRGFTVEQAMTNGLMTSGTAAFETPTFAYDKIEVVKGPESIIGGFAAKFGGVVNLVTKAPKASTSREVQFTVDSFGRTQVGFDTTGSLTEDKKLRGRLVFSADQTGSAYANWDGGHDYYVAPSLAWKSEKSQLVISAQIQNTRRPIAAGHLYSGGNDVNNTDMVEVYHAKDDALDLQMRRASFDFQQELNETWKLGVRGQFQKAASQRNFYTQTPFAYPLRLAPVLVMTSVYDQAEYSRTGQADITGKFDLGGLSHVLVAGVDYSVTTATTILGRRWDAEPSFLVEAGTTSLLPSVKLLPNQISQSRDPDSRRETGIFIQDQISIGEKWNVTGSLRRVDYRPRYGNAFEPVSKWLPGIGVVYKLDLDTSLYASSVEGVQYAYSGLTFDGSPLPPVRANQAEVGIKKSMLDGRLIGTLAAFKIQKRNEVQEDLAHPGFVEVVKGRLSKGIEAELNGKINSSLNVSAAYTYMKLTADPGAPITQSPHSLNLWANYRFIGENGYTGWNFSLGAFARSAEFIHADSINFTGKNPGNARLDMVVGYDSQTWNAKLGVKNLTGRDIFAPGSIMMEAVKEPKYATTLTANFKF